MAQETDESFIGSGTSRRIVRSRVGPEEITDYTGVFLQAKAPMWSRWAGTRRRPFEPRTIVRTTNRLRRRGATSLPFTDSRSKQMNSRPPAPHTKPGTILESP